MSGDQAVIAYGASRYGGKCRALCVTIIPADATIAEVASERGGVWSAAEHKVARPTDRLAFIERHERRLEAMSREGACKALGDGRFSIPADYQERAAAAQ